MAPTTMTVPPPARSARPLAVAGHVRSASVPCHTHPLLADVDDQLLALRSWTSKAEAVIAGREHNPTHQDCLDEMDAFFHATVAELFARARQTSLGLGPRDVDMLVVNVSTFHPAPSLAHGMRDDVQPGRRPQFWSWSATPTRTGASWSWACWAASATA